MEKALFLAAFFFAYTVQAITGFAGNLFAMPVGTGLLGLESTIAILNVLGCLACGGLALVNIKHIHWKEFGKIITVMMVFMFVGIWLDTVIPLDILLNIYGVIVIFVGVKNLAFPSKKNLPEWLLWSVLAAAGLIQGMFVSGGAFLVIYAAQKIKDKQQFRATLSLIWGVLNGIYAIFAVQAGYFEGDVIKIILFAIPLAALATFIGQKLSAKISQERFLKLTYVLLLFIGLILLFAM